MAEKPYTEADVELTVEAIARSLGHASVAAMDAALDRGGAQIVRAEARAVLDALAAAGQLVSPALPAGEFAVDRLRLDSDNPRAYVDADGRRAVNADTVAVLRERDRYREHSVTLNTITWRIASALGDVPDGAYQIEGDPVELVGRLIADRNQALERLRQVLKPALGSPPARGQEGPSLTEIREAAEDVLLQIRWQPEPLSDLLDACRRLAEAVGIEKAEG